MIEAVYVCPLGSKCEEIKDNKMHRCHWYVLLKGKDPQSEQIIDEWRCAIAVLPIIMIENAQTNRGQTQSIESFRNEMQRGQAAFNNIVAAALERKALK